MADEKKMSVEDILAACRAADGDGPAPTAEPAEEVTAPEKPAAAPSASDAPAQKPTGEMSVTDILAAARAADGSDGGATSESAPASSEAPATESQPAAPLKKASEMSVADILAAARGQGAEPAAKKTKPAAKPKAKKAPAAAAKSAPKPAAGPMDTSSILAAARKGVGDKPGPMSKAEAAAKGKAVPAKTKPMAPPMPAKPAYAQPKITKQKDDSDRRGFFNFILGSFLAVGFTSLSVTGLLSTLGLARFMFPNILIEPPSQFKVGFPSDFAPGSVATKFKAQFGVWIVNAAYEGQPQIVALKTVCTHLGCTPNWLEAEQKFKCPCHGSGFYKDGVNFEGPAPRPLERYAIRVADDGQLEIDKSKTFQQEMGQWNDGSSFVPV